MATFCSDLDHARRLYRDRRTRDEMLGAHLFGEPAWDLMLELFIARSQDRPVSTMSACIGASVSLTAGLQWVAKLEEHGFVERIRMGPGEGASWLGLTEAGFARMKVVLRHTG